MSEVEDPLYRKALLRLAADATGAGHLPAPDAAATTANPACGDTVTVEVTLEGGRVAALAHETHACILTQASATLLGRVVPGMDASALARLEAGVRAMLKDGAPPPLPDYGAFEGALPGRHVCVLLPFQALREALETSKS
jgi:nitrogen fixation protein NifU and related proteins